MTIQLPVSERVQAQVQQNLKNINEADNNGLKFMYVERFPLSHTKKYEGPAASVLDYGTDYLLETCYTLCTLNMGVEFWYKMKLGDTAQQIYNWVKAELMRVLAGSDVNLVEDTTDAKLAVNCVLISDTPDITGENDLVISGLLQFQIQYRHKKGDPYTLM